MKRALLLATVTIFSCGALLLFGGEKINLFELIDPTSPSHRILFELRGPRLLLVFFVGGSLAVLGNGFQTVFNNPLADPYLLGISSSVALGSALGEVFFKATPHSPAGPGQVCTEPWDPGWCGAGLCIRGPSATPYRRRQPSCSPAWRGGAYATWQGGAHCMNTTPPAMYARVSSEQHATTPPSASQVAALPARVATDGLAAVGDAAVSC